MKDSVNVLILSVGTRNKIVDYFKRELGPRGIVAATDCSPLAPALYAADRHFVVPPIGAGGYLETLWPSAGIAGRTVSFLSSTPSRASWPDIGVTSRK